MANQNEFKVSIKGGTRPGTITASLNPAAPVGCCSNNIDANDLSLIQTISKALANGTITSSSASNIISMRIKSIILRLIRATDDVIDIEVLIYFDSIMFSNINDMIKSIINCYDAYRKVSSANFCRDTTFSKNLIIKFIIDTLASFEYSLDLAEVNEVIDEFYNTFG